MKNDAASAVGKTYRFDSGLIDDQWIDGVAITVTDGWITGIHVAGERDQFECKFIKGVVIPGVPNVHSHAFQRGFAGLSEYRTADQDSFWTWRELMYEFVWKLNPDDVHGIAKQVYLEMLRVGYSWVGEFHYLHNDRNGDPYPRDSEMAEVIIQAAVDAGIGICLLPTLYQQGGFNRPLLDSQRRFALDEESLLQLIGDCDAKHSSDANFCVGLAIHSLRAVDTEVGRRVVDAFQIQYPGRPIHIHVAEQVNEVKECLAATGQRPIEFLDANFDLNDRWCLVHATHANRDELQKIARSRATVGLCPTTESNLGDGIFPAGEFLDLGGRFGVGSDSHVSVNLASELRTLEYGHRLVERKRAVLGSQQESVGRNLYRRAATGGAQSLGVKTGRIAVGERADLIVVDSRHPTVGGSTQDRLLDRLIFCEHGNPISHTMVGGNWIDVAKRLENHRDDFLKVLLKLNQSV